jgi:hypothetical protein
MASTFLFEYCTFDVISLVLSFRKDACTFHVVFGNVYESESAKSFVDDAIFS